mmetsp:Transcript_19469/g.27726  ORF Transcript_19469/g.27726 Transcript_19469/m.27726 type:complete len:227 (-) Transcript_19469:118-798(-)
MIRRKMSQRSIYHRQEVRRRARGKVCLQIGSVGQSRVVACLRHKKGLRLGKIHRIGLVAHIHHRKKTVLSYHRELVGRILHRKTVLSYRMVLIGHILHRKKTVLSYHRELVGRILLRKKLILRCSSLLDMVRNTLRWGFRRGLLDSCRHRKKMMHRRRSLLDCTVDLIHRNFLHCWVRKDLLDDNWAFLRYWIRRDLVRDNWDILPCSDWRILGPCWHSNSFYIRR